MNESCIVEPLPLFKGERRSYSGILQPFAEHAHDHYVFGIVRDGERMLSLNGRSARIKRGDLLVFNPGDAHGCVQTGAAPFAYESVAVAAEAEVLQGKRFCPPDPDDVLLRKLFEDLLLLIDGRRESEALEAFAFFGQALAGMPDVHSGTAKHEKAATRLYVHMLGHLAARVRVRAFAKSEGISPSALIRSYHRVFRLTPVQHQLALRVDAACGLLAKGANAAETAAELGFSDQSHLTREFKKRIGCTPGAYAAMRKAGARRK